MICYYVCPGSVSVVNSTHSTCTQCQGVTSITMMVGSTISCTSSCPANYYWFNSSVSNLCANFTCQELSQKCLTDSCSYGNFIYNSSFSCVTACLPPLFVFVNGSNLECVSSCANNEYIIVGSTN